MSAYAKLSTSDVEAAPIPTLHDLQAECKPRFHHSFQRGGRGRGKGGRGSLTHTQGDNQEPSRRGKTTADEQLRCPLTSSCAQRISSYTFRR